MAVGRGGRRRPRGAVRRRGGTGGPWLAFVPALREGACGLRARPGRRRGAARAVRPRGGPAPARGPDGRVGRAVPRQRPHVSARLSDRPAPPGSSRVTRARPRARMAQ
ncbi:conserved hypothetical protein [Micrococcus sp. 116]|nr:conserved hypothetical protein [Micrococcus sp. 116]